MSNVRTKLSALLCVAALAAACGGSPTQPSPVGPGQIVPPIAGGTGGAPGLPLEKTSFMAFGDSMTEGTVTTLSGLLRIVIAPQSYPYKLKVLLADRHPGQQIEVYNEGLAGEHTSDGLVRLPGTLAEDKPQVLLLFEGVNDLSVTGSLAIPETIANLRTMIEEAKGAGVMVFVATLLPQRPGGQRARSPEAIEPFNMQLAALAASEGVTLVDLYKTFAADLSLIGPDGLHPTVDGYTKMAGIWADAIDATLETPLPKTTSVRPALPRSIQP